MSHFNKVNVIFCRKKIVSFNTCFFLLYLFTGVGESGGKKCLLILTPFVLNLGLLPPQSCLSWISRPSLWGSSPSRQTGSTWQHFPTSGEAWEHHRLSTVQNPKKNLLLQTASLRSTKKWEYTTVTYQTQHRVAAEPLLTECVHVLPHLNAALHQEAVMLPNIMKIKDKIGRQN